jgi:hypothetical protein
VGKFHRGLSVWLVPLFTTKRTNVLSRATFPDFQSKPDLKNIQVDLNFAQLNGEFGMAAGLKTLTSDY